MRTSLVVLLSLTVLVACSSEGDSSGVTASSGAGAASTSSASGAGGSGASSSSGSSNGGGPAVTVGAGAAGGGIDCLDTLTVRVRDFSQSHPDFQWSGHPNFAQMTGVKPGILGTQLVEENGSYKPVYVAGSDVSPNGPTIAPFTGAANFDTWYRDTPGVNHAIDVELPLDGVDDSLIYDDDDFHPVGASFGFGDEGFELNGMPNNWHFTTEAHVRFRYQGGEVFTFRGDDDIWIFINHTLAIDLGGIHGPEERSIVLDDEATALGLIVGEDYDLHVFHAERNYSGSNYRFQTNDFCFVPVEPPT